ncbi:MAG: class I poly(R)-hydroxyalkanoic acid synthase [Hydrogenophilaceae bacterium]|jgi:polyhydroxyalkanoate synthase|nr:class I poly(R)-hydroxyalkanoic acid synthase [Hydrogenophilaceae bacterium]
MTPPEDGSQRSGKPAEGAPAKPRRKRAAAKKAQSTPAGAPASKEAAVSAPPAPRPAAASPEPKPAPAASLPEVFAAQTPESLADLSRNIAEAMNQANSVFADAFLRHARPTPAPQHIDPFGVGPAMAEMWSHLIMQPETVRDAFANLWKRYADIWERHALNLMMGPPEGGEPVRDKRFKDPEWSTNPGFALMRDAYLATAQFFIDLVERTEGLDDAAKRKAAFFMRQAVDAASPSNFLLTNPAALRALIETRGESLKKGMENFARDLKRGGGALAITQTDMTAFKLGENIATSPGKVVFRNQLIELLQYEPTTETVHEVPLLIFPPWINKFYILDLQPKNSMIRWLVSQGHTVFVASWVNPDAEMAEATFEDYMRDGVFAAVKAVLDATGVDRVNTVGYCIGGTLLAACLGYMANKGDRRIQSATFFASQSDFELAGDLKVFADKTAIEYLSDRIDQHGGFLDAQAMADTFNALRANDLIWNYIVDNYYLGNKPPPFDLLYWNSDQTRMPRALHLFYLNRFYHENAMAKNEMTLLGEPIRLAKVKIPIYMQSSKEDHIAPAASVYRSAKLFGGPVTFTLAGSGHIAGVINPPSANKYQHWVNPKLPDTFEEWLEGAEERPGSWWPHWNDWLAKISGPDAPARHPGDGDLPVLGEAPGEYVKVRSAA